MLRFRGKIKEANNKLKQVESLVHDIYWGRTSMVTKERVSMACAAVENLPPEIWSKITKIEELKGQWIIGARLGPRC